MRPQALLLSVLLAGCGGPNTVYVYEVVRGDDAGDDQAQLPEAAAPEAGAHALQVAASEPTPEASTPEDAGDGASRGCLVVNGRVCTGCWYMNDAGVVGLWDPCGCAAATSLCATSP